MRGTLRRPLATNGIRSARAALLLLLLAASIVALGAAPADAARKRRKARATRTVRHAPVGNLHIVVLEDRAEPGALEPEWAPSTRTVRLIDAYGVKWASHPDSTGLATFTGVFSGRAIVYVDAIDSTGAGGDTLWIETGRTRTDTLRSLASGERRPTQ